MHTLTLLHSSKFPIRSVCRRVYARGDRPASRRQSGRDHDRRRRLAARRPGRSRHHRQRRDRQLDGRTAVVGVGLAEQPTWLADDSIYLHLAGRSVARSAPQRR